MVKIKSKRAMTYIIELTQHFRRPLKNYVKLHGLTKTLNIKVLKSCIVPMEMRFQLGYIDLLATHLAVNKRHEKLSKLPCASPLLQYAVVK